MKLVLWQHSNLCIDVIEAQQEHLPRAICQISGTIYKDTFCETWFLKYWNWSQYLTTVNIKVFTQFTVIFKQILPTTKSMTRTKKQIKKKRKESTVLTTKKFCCFYALCSSQLSKQQLSVVPVVHTFAGGLHFMVFSRCWQTSKIGEYCFAASQTNKMIKYRCEYRGKIRSQHISS